LLPVLAFNISLLSVCRVPPDFQILFHGVSGAWSSRFFNWRIPRPLPDVIFIQVGENEIGALDPDQIINNIIRLCIILLRSGVPHIMVGAMIPRLRPRHLSVS